MHGRESPLVDDGSGVARWERRIRSQQPNHLRRTTERLRPDRCIGILDRWTQRCVCSCGRRKRSSGRICIWSRSAPRMRMCQEGQKEFAAGSWTDERPHAVNHLHVVAAAFLLNFIKQLSDHWTVQAASIRDLRRSCSLLFACTAACF